MHDKVDVLIIGSGASGAAVAWSLADTRMRILCLEQGDWVKPTDYPSNGRDWEARLFSDFAINPNRRARPTDYPINDANSPIKVVNFNGVGGSTIMYTAHFPRLHPSDFKEHFQAAEVVVIACNGVGTPRLMLNSVSAKFPNGIANSSGLVGKNLMFHPYALSYGYVDEPLDGNHGPPLCLWSQEFYETDKKRDFVRGYTFQFGRGVGAIMEAIVSSNAGRLPWGEGHHGAYRKLVNRRIGLSAICEDLPEEHNRVTLDPVLKDSHGIPAPKLDYTISANSLKMMNHGIARAKE